MRAQLDAAGVAFIGPRADTIELMGDKVRARRFVAERGFPVAPSAIEDDDPVIFLEPKRVYNGPFDGHHDKPVVPWSQNPMGEVPEGYYTVPLDVDVSVATLLPVGVGLLESINGMARGPRVHQGRRSNIYSRNLPQNQPERPSNQQAPHLRQIGRAHV